MLPFYYSLENLVFRAMVAIFVYADKGARKFEKLNIQHPTLNIEH